MPAAFAQIADTTVYNGSDGDWNTAGNWTNGLPTTGSAAGILDGSTVGTSANAAGDMGQLLLTGGSTLDLNHTMGITSGTAGGGLYIGGNPAQGGAATLNINNGGTLTVGAGVENFRVGRNNTTSTLNLKDGGTLNSAIAIYIGKDNLNNSIFNQTGGTLNHTSGDFQVGASNGNGVWNMSGGTANISNMRVGFADSTADRSGTVNQTGGTVNHTAGDAAVGWGANNVGSHTYNLQNGNFNVQGTGRLRIGQGGAGSNATNLFNQTGGAVDIAGSRLDIGDGNLGENSYRIADGSLTVGSHIFVGYSTKGTLTVDGGTVEFDNATIANRDIVLGNNSGTAEGTVNLNGGLVTVEQIRTGASTAAQELNFNGGTIKAYQNQGNWIQDSSNTLTATLMAGGGTFDTAGFDVGIQVALGGSGDLTKVGLNQLKLGKANTYTGDTIVNEGKLTLLNGGELAFVIGANGVNNQITGDGDGHLGVSGDFVFDLSGAGTTAGDSWTIIDKSNVIVDGITATFEVVGFTDAGGNLWTKDINGTDYYEFSEATGTLSVIPEPATLGLVAAFGAGILFIRRRLMI
jgi:autotransporter-associated beta strand protein